MGSYHVLLFPRKLWQAKLSTAGFICLLFGHKLLAYLLAIVKVSILYDKMYENFVKQVDMVDNGLSQRTEGEPQ